VESFAFNSALTGFDASTSRATVHQRRQWALVDIVGASSAAFAAFLAQLASSYARSPDLLAAVLHARAPAAVNFLARHGVPTATSRTRLEPALAAHARGDASQIRALARELEGLIPAYQYWPVLVWLKISDVSTSLRLLGLGEYWTERFRHASNLRNGDDPPCPDRHGCRMAAAAPATGHHLSPRGKPRPQSPTR
jgi:hypothetical protein